MSNWLPKFTLSHYSVHNGCWIMNPMYMFFVMACRCWISKKKSSYVEVNWKIPSFPLKYKVECFPQSYRICTADTEELKRSLGKMYWALAEWYATLWNILLWLYILTQQTTPGLQLQIGGIYSIQYGFFSCLSSIWFHFIYSQLLHCHQYTVFSTHQLLCMVEINYWRQGIYSI